MNVLLDYQIILLPKHDYWPWVRACAKYVIEFGANLTDDPQTAIGYMAPGQVISFPAGDGLFPDHKDLKAWLQENAPGIRLDPIGAKSPKELKAALKKRIKTDDRYGQKQRPFYLLWPTDYPVITQGFGANPQIYTRFGMPGHEGLDIRALTNTNIYCCAEGSVYEVHTNPEDHPYGIHVRVRHKDGYRTVYGHMARALVSVGEFVAAGQVLGKADSTGASTGAHLHFTLERDGATARKETTYPKDVLDPTPFMVWPDGSHKKSLPELVWPAGRCLVGGAASDGSALAAPDLEMVRTAKLEAVQITASETPENIASLRQIRPGMLLVARLSVDVSGGAIAPKDFVRLAKDNVLRASEAGVRYFEIGGEPNLQSGGWGRSWQTGREFGDWFKEVVAGLKRIARQAQFGFPGLAPGGDVVGWREDAERFLVDAQSAAAGADWVGIDFFGGPPTTGWEKRLAQLLALYRAAFPNTLFFLTQRSQVEAGAGPESRARYALAIYRRLRHEPAIGAVFCEGPAISPGSTQAGWRSSDGQSLGIAEAVGQRSF
jgi:murein DD-endopeptidase MepM/ murein hydrolase activator NlpD